VFRCIVEHPIVVMALIPVVGAGGVYVGYKYGRHNDIPFKQYLRFQVGSLPPKNVQGRLYMLETCLAPHSPTVVLF
jgi:hypothetical protein